MLNIEISLNALSLVLMTAGSFGFGYYLRSRQLKKKQFKISELRKEIVYNHAQILELQKEYVSLEKTMNVQQATVLPMINSLPELKEKAAL
jgi:hypothetical protein